MKYGMALLALAGCAAPSGTPPAPATLARAESLFIDTRSLKDRIDVHRLWGRGDSAAALGPEYLAARERLAQALTLDSSALLDSVDRRAVRIMRQVLVDELTPTPEAPGTTAVIDSAGCRYDPAAIPEIDSLEARLYACYGRAASGVEFEGHRLERLTVLGLLGSTGDPAQRRRLFLALDPVWRSVNGNDDSKSPWRELLRRRARAWGAGPTPFARRAAELGLAPDSARDWLTRVLQRWRATLSDSVREPWDLYYAMGGASRRLDARVPLESLRIINDRFYRDLGADPVRLNVQYDLAPRAGKDPVAFTTFGARPVLRQGVWQPGAPYISSSYPKGGFDNLGQQLHEMGHAIHIAAIRTRPAFTDWPDADLFTEAIADLADVEATEGRWQQHYLGDSASTADNLHAKYFGLAMDACWALFEDRMQRDPTLDPNVVWAALTERYLNVVPHSEWSWWAMRGQLVDAPSYLMNYAIGAFVTADLRARLQALHGAFTLGDSTWYGFVRERIYRFGLERSSRRVMEDFLGRPLSPDALLTDLRRGASAETRDPAR